MMGVVFMAEKEGFEPSIPFWGIHDFQSCALGQLRDFSKSCNQLAYNTAFGEICQELIFIFSGFFRGKEKAVDKEGIYSYNV